MSSALISRKLAAKVLVHVQLQQLTQHSTRLSKFLFLMTSLSIYQLCGLNVWCLIFSNILFKYKFETFKFSQNLSTVSAWTSQQLRIPRRLTTVLNLQPGSQAFETKIERKSRFQLEQFPFNLALFRTVEPLFPEKDISLAELLNSTKAFLRRLAV